MIPLVQFRYISKSTGQKFNNSIMLSFAANDPEGQRFKSSPRYQITIQHTEITKETPHRGSSLSATLNDTQRQYTTLLDTGIGTIPVQSSFLTIRKQSLSPQTSARFFH